MRPHNNLLIESGEFKLNENLGVFDFRTGLEKMGEQIMERFPPKFLKEKTRGN